MQRVKRRAGRFALWAGLNLAIFLACYLNYRLQPKHRYLYRTLNVGLCLSRAAAMMINFNLLLVWLPMCKYSLTRLAELAGRAARAQRQRLKELALEEPQTPELAHKSPPRLTVQLKIVTRTLVRHLVQKLVLLRLRLLAGFLLAVDHCTSLHTICATTITLASMIHTLAHLMNVINFSKNFDPFLSNLNMAEFRGQNPLQMLISVPGITGFLMILILVLMSLSSMNCFRSSSFDLFQLVHRLSVVFVVLLFLHPSSHILKEQSNVARHHPDLCYNATLAIQVAISRPNGQRLAQRSIEAQAAKPTPIAQPFTATSGASQTACLDLRPTFVAQSSICCYVLAIGLSCYLLDLALRRQRRSRSPVRLLAARCLTNTDEQQLIELVLSSNHSRFKRWLPGQFVYLNCPQLATFEWHPFTISSMDANGRQFTLHIKTAGDWTHRLRSRLMRSSRAEGTNSNPVSKLQIHHSGSDFKASKATSLDQDDNLSFFVDGPFHSPFERLLEQQVSVCIANGVGWTAFSPVFQCITSDMHPLERGLKILESSAPKDPEAGLWWTRWDRFLVEPSEAARRNLARSRLRPFRGNNLHMLIVVSSLEQLIPFFELALNYFHQIHQGAQLELANSLNPVREIRALITRSTIEEPSVRQFCTKHNLKLDVSLASIQVNELFTIKFEKPDFERYLKSLRQTHQNRPKISIYCCGSFPVKQTVRNLCHNLEKPAGPRLSYHEENF